MQQWGNRFDQLRQNLYFCRTFFYRIYFVAYALNNLQSGENNCLANVVKIFLRHSLSSSLPASTSVPGLFSSTSGPHGRRTAFRRAYAWRRLRLPGRRAPDRRSDAPSGADPSASPAGKRPPASARPPRLRRRFQSPGRRRGLNRVSVHQFLRRAAEELTHLFYINPARSSEPILISTHRYWRNADFFSDFQLLHAGPFSVRFNGVHPAPPFRFFQNLACNLQAPFFSGILRSAFPPHQD